MIRQVKHYLSSFVSTPIHFLTKDFGESNTDRSFFRPDISSVRAFLGSDMSTVSNKVGVYDFPDGKDNGDFMQAKLRDKGLDITELDAIGDKIKAKMESDIALQKSEKEIKKDKEIMEVMHKNIEKIASGKSSDDVEKTEQ